MMVAFDLVIMVRYLQYLVDRDMIYPSQKAPGRASTHSWSIQQE